MSNDLEIIRRNDAIQKVFITDDAIEVKDLALAKSSLIGKVENAAQQNVAVAAQTDLQSIRSACEKARKAVKQPVIDYGRLIDDTAKKFCVELDEELLRLAHLIGDFQALEQANARAAERLKQKELEQVEKDRQTELAAAKTHEALDAINQRYSERAAEVVEKPTAAPARAEGQIVRDDWEITVTDIWLLVKAHPLCVKVEPKLSEIKSLLNAGVTVAGVSARRITKSSVRTKPTSTSSISV